MQVLHKTTRFAYSEERGKTNCCCNNYNGAAGRESLEECLSIFNLVEKCANEAEKIKDSRSYCASRANTNTQHTYTARLYICTTNGTLWRSTPCSIAALEYLHHDVKNGVEYVSPFLTAKGRDGPVMRSSREKKTREEKEKIRIRCHCWRIKRNGRGKKYHRNAQIKREENEISHVQKGDADRENGTWRANIRIRGAKGWGLRYKYKGERV